MKFKVFGTDNLAKFQRPKLSKLETVLTYILSEGMPKEYNPGENVMTMAVACGRYLNEGTVIRLLHNVNYRIPFENVTIIGCDIDELQLTGGSLSSRDDDYDLVLRGFQGDASTDNPWDLGLSHTHNKKQGYDFAHINFPDFYDIGAWLKIAKKSLEFILKGGMLTIISQDEEDITKLMQLHDRLTITNQKGLLPLQGFRYEGNGFNQKYGLLTIQNIAN